jgi:hypothetical protein
MATVGIHPFYSPLPPSATEINEFAPRLNDERKNKKCKNFTSPNTEYAVQEIAPCLIISGRAIPSPISRLRYAPSGHRISRNVM